MPTYSPTQPNWPLACQKLKEAYGILNDEDLRYEPGQEQQLKARLALRLQRDPLQIQRLLESFGIS
ncbi:hypothetical protein [Vampirovibrio sp.]|uniref:hypothetical protein n=1 Tax=Vampirovibrio sp. TaxID=2717857 RepID=UPI0035949448